MKRPMQASTSTLTPRATPMNQTKQPAQSRTSLIPGPGILFRSTARVVLVAFLATIWPQEAIAAVTEQVAQALPLHPLLAPPPTKPGNRTLPRVMKTPSSVAPRLSLKPTSAELTSLRIFEEPLIADGSAASADTAALGESVRELLRSPSESFEPLQSFLSAHPESAWGVSLHTNLGLRLQRSGRLTRAIA